MPPTRVLLFIWRCSCGLQAPPVSSLPTTPKTRSRSISQAWYAITPRSSSADTNLSTSGCWSLKTGWKLLLDCCSTVGQAQTRNFWESSTRTGGIDRDSCRKRFRLPPLRRTQITQSLRSSARKRVGQRLKGVSIGRQFVSSISAAATRKCSRLSAAAFAYQSGGIPRSHRPQMRPNWARTYDVSSRSTSEIWTGTGFLWALGRLHASSTPSACSSLSAHRGNQRLRSISSTVSNCCLWTAIALLPLQPGRQTMISQLSFQGSSRTMFASCSTSPKADLVQGCRCESGGCRACSPCKRTALLWTRRRRPYSHR
mmetsp:Transcript_78247/g.162487  ORF Transcript_78247/g.162487 Transcript_78247/m.162487 type:complete len:313 (-) Transcript_78247:85-1023(-)